jgi:hypothetical protein
VCSITVAAGADSVKQEIVSDLPGYNPYPRALVAELVDAQG